MKTAHFFVGALALLTLAGCAKGPRMQPANALNEPVFYAKPYAAIGIGGGLMPSKGGAFLPGDTTYSDGIFVEPTLSWFTPVNSWAGYALLPVYWNFLLTGNQYEDGGDPALSNLKTGKLHLAVSGGLTGAAYSGRDGWEFSFGSSLRGKYLFTHRLYSEVSYDAQINHTFTAAYDGWSAGLGYQLLPTFSLIANYSGARFTMAENRYVTVNGMDMLTGDLVSAFGVTAPWYITPKHVIAPEASCGFRNTGADDGAYWRAGAHYRFVFD